MAGEIAANAFSDAVRASELLEDTDDRVLMRIFWFGAVGILRTVGDVLDKDEDVEIRRKFQQKMRLWKKASESSACNYWYDFIRSERNYLSHEYDHGHINDSPVFIVSNEEELVDLSDLADVFWPMDRGPWEGEDARDVLQGAIIWLRGELLGMGVNLK